MKSNNDKPTKWRYRRQAKKNMFLVRHRCVIAPSGGGKTSSRVVPDIYQGLKMGHSVIVLDPGSSSFRETAYAVVKHGAVLRKLDFANFEASDSINVFQLFNMPIKDKVMIAQLMANVIIENTNFTENMNFWSSAGKEILSSIILRIQYGPQIPGIYPGKNLKAVYELMMMDESTALNYVIEGGSEVPKAAKRIAEKYSNPVMLEKKGITSSAFNNITNMLEGLASDEISEVLCGDDIDFALPATKQCVYYIGVSEQHKTYHWAAALILQCMLIAMVDGIALKSKKGRFPVTVDFIIDEFANTVKIPEFRSRLKTARKRGLFFCIIIQDLQDLLAVYKNKAEAMAILSGFDYIICMGTNDMETARYIEDLCGTHPVVIKNPDGSIKETRSVPVCPAQDVRKLGNDERGSIPGDTIVILRKNNPLICWRFDQTEHPYYDEEKNIDPNDYIPLRERNTAETPIETEVTEEKDDTPQMPEAMFASGMDEDW